jgi:hypothetical protein
MGTGGGTATISASYSDYNPVENVASQNASISGFHVSNVGDAGFNENTGHEYELLPNSRCSTRVTRTHRRAST